MGLLPFGIERAGLDAVGRLGAWDGRRMGPAASLSLKNTISSESLPACSLKACAAAVLSSTNAEFCWVISSMSLIELLLS